MNTANLQLEGLLIAIASLNDLLVTKGIVHREEVAHAMDVAEQTVLGDYRTEELDPAQRDAIAFPVIGVGSSRGRLVLARTHARPWLVVTC
ncbi:MAG: hypothetical protein JWQ65_2073 [Devosia sp.]|nr:hypothetical protein [Devosia sp.]